MSGLIMKELMFLKSNLNVRLILFFAVYIFVMFQVGIDGAFIFPIIGVMLSMNSFSYDEFNNWYSYVSTLPNGRRSCVLAKYITSVLFAFILCIISFIITLGTGFIASHTADISEASASLAGVIFSVIIMISLIYPMMFRFGANNGRIWMFVLVFLILGIGGLASNYIDIDVISSVFQSIENYLYIALPLLSVVMLSVSCFISLKIFEHREF